jgi:DNA-binding NtrC family response regulator
MTTVLVVDDKELMRDSVAATLERAGFTIVTATDGPAALDLVAKSRPDCVVTDMRMPKMTGIELVERVRRIDDELPVLVMTAFGTIDTAVRAMREGAFDYLTKPFEGDELVIAVKRALEHRRVTRENALLRAAQAPLTSNLSQPTQPNGVAHPAGSASASQHAPRFGVERLIGDSPAMRRVREQVASLAASTGTVLITGESGVGKEVVARAIHESGPRREGAFLAVNCAALSASLLESELFGHERGAFTGADRLRKGRFELADGGTLLLDEVSEVSPQIQAKLLRVLQERAFERVGSSLTIGVDVRVVATSNRDLQASVAKGEFRQDLFFRLNVLPVRVPHLRERGDDVIQLARHFVAAICAREGRPALALDASVEALLLAYSWPGNVRELQNICERAVVLTPDRSASRIDAALIAPWLASDTLAPQRIPSAFGSTAPLIEPKPLPPAHPAASASGSTHAPLAGASLAAASAAGSSGTSGAAADLAPIRTLEEIERDTIVGALVRFKGHRQRTAAALGIGVRTLGLKLKRWKEQRLVAESL